MVAQLKYVKVREIQNGEHEKLWGSQYAETEGIQEWLAVYFLGDIFGD